MDWIAAGENSLINTIRNHHNVLATEVSAPNCRVSVRRNGGQSDLRITRRLVFPELQATSNRATMQTAESEADTRIRNSDDS